MTDNSNNQNVQTALKMYLQQIEWQRRTKTK